MPEMGLIVKQLRSFLRRMPPCDGHDCSRRIAGDVLSWSPCDSRLLADLIDAYEAEHQAARLIAGYSGRSLPPGPSGSLP